jgi:hypothetical protein
MDPVSFPVTAFGAPSRAPISLTYEGIAGIEIFEPRTVRIIIRSSFVGLAFKYALAANSKKRLRQMACTWYKGGKWLPNTGRLVHKRLDMS